MTPAGRQHNGGERREISPLVLGNSHPLSPQSFSRNPVCPLHRHVSATGNPSGQVGFGGWLQLGSYKRWDGRPVGCNSPSSVPKPSSLLRVACVAGVGWASLHWLWLGWSSFSPEQPIWCRVLDLDLNSPDNTPMV